MAKNVTITRVSAFVLVVLLAVCFTPQSTYAAGCKITVGDYSGIIEPSGTFTVPVSISDNPGLSVAVFEAVYNHNALQLISVDTNGAIIGSDNLVYSSSKPDAISIIILSNGQATNGVLFNMTFQVKSAATTSSYDYSIKILDDLPKNFASFNSGKVENVVSFQGGSVQVNAPDPGTGTNPDNPGGNPGNNGGNTGNTGGGNSGNTGGGRTPTTGGTTQGGGGTGAQTGTGTSNVTNATGNVADSSTSTIPNSQTPTSSGNSNKSGSSKDISDNPVPMKPGIDDGFKFTFFPWGLLTLLLVVALGSFFFFIIAKRRKKDEEELEKA